MRRKQSLLACWMLVSFCVPVAAQYSYPQYQYPRYQQPVYRYPTPTYRQPIPGQPVYRPVQPGRVIDPNTISPTQPGTPTKAVPNFKKPWYQNLLAETNHNFGTVAYASKQEKVFQFQNNTGADLFLTGIRTSCGCTKPEILTPHVKPGETAKILAKFDTRAFYGKRGATVTVSLQKNQNQIRQTGELQLTVNGDIRRDVVLSPGEIDFKTITLDEPVTTLARIAYAGRLDWKIEEVRSTNNNISAKVREIERNAGTGRTTYEMVVRVNPSQPVGRFAESLTIITNDAKTTGMSFRVGGSVQPTIAIVPIALGVINKGQAITKKLIIRSPKAVAIKSIETGNAKIKFEPPRNTKSTLHILKYTLDTSEPDNINQRIKIITQGETEITTAVPFSVQIVPATQVRNENDQ